MYSVRKMKRMVFVKVQGIMRKKMWGREKKVKLVSKARKIM